MSFARSRLVWLLILGLSPTAHAAQDSPLAEPDAQFFREKVLPLLEARCLSCHGPDTTKGGLRLDSRSALLQGGDSGPAAEPGNPEESLLVEAIQYQSIPAMPPKSKLPDGEIAILVDWVARGLPWPDDSNSPAPPHPASPTFNLDERARHWSFQPVSPPTPPDVQDSSWPLGPIDRFILHALEAEGLRPAPDAHPLAWLRRVTFDLTGLPPTPSEIDDFLRDTSAHAYETVVDRLLASPRYGERWARHWLDLVRYAETSGHEFDYDIPNAWRYRDYVVRALNHDLPYNQFVLEHIAGDLLPTPRRNPIDGSNESILATGFFFLGEGTHSPVDLLEERTSRIDNQIDVLGKAFLGLTIACARCHDHKFDPISTQDYYALAGFLRSSRHQQAFLDPPSRLDEPAKTLSSLRSRIAEQLAFQAPSPAAAPHAGHADSFLFADFSGETYSPWISTGQAFGDGPTSSPCLRIDDRTDPPSLSLLPPGLAHSGLDSSRFTGVLRSPTFDIQHPYIWYLASGQAGRINLVIDGFEKIRAPIYGGLTLDVDSPEAFRWYVQDVAMWIGHRAYIELADGAFVDFRNATTSIPPGEGFLAVNEIRFADHPDPGPPPEAKPVPVPLGLCAGPLASLLDQHRTIASNLPAPTLGLAIADGSPEDAPVQIRGSTRNLGPVVPRRFLQALGGRDHPDQPGSGRLQLARHIADPSNPLTPRVLVNRLWHHHFGAGLVSSPDDFGHMGQPPTHPQLLDWLAATLIDDGWSLKSMHRRIVLSRTYRQASLTDPDSDARDPANRLLHRTNLRRLEAEAIRDAMLSVSGRLDPAIGGPSVPPHLTPFMDGRGRPRQSGPLDGAGRRTLYINVRRNFLPPLLQAFDFPTPASCIGRRNVSNVPGQALALLNDPFTIEQARLWATRELELGGSPNAIVHRLYQRAFARPPDLHELQHASTFLASGLSNSTSPDPNALTDLCHVLLNAKEFIFLP